MPTTAQPTDFIASMRERRLLGERPTGRCLLVTSAMNLPAQDIALSYRATGLTTTWPHICAVFSINYAGVDQPRSDDQIFSDATDVRNHSCQANLVDWTWV